MRHPAPLSFLTFAVALIGIVGISCSALADASTTPGCNPLVMNTLQKKATAKVAQDVATVKQTIDQPDSVMSLSCFNKAAGTTAKKAGDIFSEDFTTELTPLITASLTSDYNNFKDSPGFATGAISYTDTSVDNSSDCDNLKDMWKQITERGIQSGVPYPTIDSLINGTVPTGAGDTFKKDWDQANTDGIFPDLKAAFDANPKPKTPSFAGALTTCQVLAAAGVGGTCP